MKKTERKSQRTPSKETGAPKAEVTKRKPAPPATSRSGNQTSENLGLSEIKQLIELISEKQFNEFELERGNFRLRLSKGVGKAFAIPTSNDLAAAVQAIVPAPVATPAPSPAPSVASAPVAPEENLHILTSPIVGTFYRSPSPTAAPFVNLGDSVEVDKVVCIIEAMKLMNEIQSDASGVIAKVFVENGQPVEFGQPLFGIRK